jgi:hypothetical protein
LEPASFQHRDHEHHVGRIVFNDQD